MRPNVHWPGLYYCIRDNSHQYFLYWQQSLDFEDFVTKALKIQKPNPKQKPQSCMWKDMVGWTGRTASLQLDWHVDPEGDGQSLEDHGGCIHLGSGFSVSSWCDLEKDGQFLHDRVLLWGQRTFWSTHWLRSLSQSESVWLRKESQTCHSGLELCVTWETATTCREQCLARVMLLVIPELNKVGSGLSLFCWSHREKCRVPMAEFSARFHGAGIIFTKCCVVPSRMGLRWGCSNKSHLGNNSLGYEFIGVCESVLNRGAFTFPLTCLLSQDWEDSKGSSQ